jgi:hypothetical protein
MLGSTVLYVGVAIGIAGLIGAVAPLRRFRRRRRRMLAIAAAGVVAMFAALLAPAFESRASAPASQLDGFMPAWQFHEIHIRRIDATPQQVFDAIKQVRADDILLFRTLTWIRRGGRPLPPGILNAGVDEPIVTIATRGGFVILADDPPRELVLGTIVVRPRGPRPSLTPDTFRQPWPPGFALAAMNFRIAPDGATRSVVTTETRVYATSAGARRAFARYWRVIYPGSALIRRMWLRAIERRTPRDRNAAAE